MTDSPSDQYRDRETNERLKSIAASIFTSYSVDFNTARRAGGWTNATWLAGGLVLRLSTQPGNDKIRREARLAALLPPEAGYPSIVATGETGGYEWSLSRDIPGICLGEVWPGLGWADRTSTLCQLWQKAQAVHTLDSAAVSTIARRRAWFNSNDAAEAEASATRLVEQKIITARQAEVLGAALDRFWYALPAAACVLNHGDLTLDNAIWRDGLVVSLLDFEYAVVAPAELDLNTFLKHAFAPTEIIDPLPDPGSEGVRAMRQAVAALAAPVIAHPGGPDLLLGYAILLELWQLQNWLAHPDGEGPLERWDPYLRLLSLADGQGGYLAPVLAR